MNKYLEKISEVLDNKNKEIARTFAEASAMALPAHAAGAWAGKALLKNRLGGYGPAIGSTIAGGITDLIALKRGADRQSKQRK